MYDVCLLAEGENEKAWLKEAGFNHIVSKFEGSSPHECHFPTS